jgi:hypothetical protein
MNIVACSITRSKEACQTKIHQNLLKINQTKNSSIKLHLKCNNSKIGLSEYYNNCIDEFAKNNDYMIFVHDDVEFINTDLSYQIQEGMKKYDVLGVAGCTNPQIKDKNLWHLMADRSDLRGFAGHTCPETNNQLYVTVFGPTPSRVLMIDGVVMIINCKKILETGVRFDHTYKFHHYDMDFSLSCNMNKLKIGTWPILINHSSPGLREFHQQWIESNDYFKNKWIKIFQKN